MLCRCPLQRLYGSVLFRLRVDGAVSFWVSNLVDLLRMVVRRTSPPDREFEHDLLRFTRVATTFCNAY